MPVDREPRASRAPTWLGRDLRLLLVGRSLRSVTLGYLNVIAPLYLARLGYSAAYVGGVFTAGALGSMALTGGVGVLADRFGRKRLLVALALLTAASGLGFALGRGYAVLLVAAALGTVGRGGGAGAGGSFGPYFPAEQALIAEHAGDRYRTNAFGVMALVGVLSAAAGSLVAMAPALLRRTAGVSTLAGDRALFLVTAAMGVVMALVVLPVHERPRVPRPYGARRLGPNTARLLPRFLVTNATNGLAVGMLGPVMVYWFHVRYGATSAELGALYFVVNLAAAPSNVLAPALARRLGAVRAVVASRLTAVALLAAMAVMPAFWMAGVLLLLRTQVNTLSNPIRQSFLMGVVDEADRSTAAGVSNLPLQALSAIGPAAAGQLMQSVWLDLPLELAAVLQGVNAVLYWLFFRDVRLPEERG